MDDFTDIDGIILKVLNGSATKEEKDKVTQWANEANTNRFALERLKGIWSQRSGDPYLIGHEEQKRKLWMRFNETERRVSPRAPIPFYQQTWVRIAVVIVIIFFPVYTVYFQSEKTPISEIEAISIVRKANPTGQKSLIHLPDGSKVWLNSASKISYVEQFSDSLRSIKLEGEAYFDVVEDSLRPFVVDFESLVVRVLGTEFSVCAFGQDKDLRITLVEGSVKVLKATDPTEGNQTLHAGTGLVYSKEKGKFLPFTKKSNPELFNKGTEWKNGHLIFDGRNFLDFVSEISRWYGVKVVVKGSPPKGWNIRARFENELLTNVLEAVAYNKGFTYSLNGKELVITFDKNKSL